MFCWCKLVSHSPFRPLVHRLRRVLWARADESLHSVTHRMNIFSKTGDFSCFNLWCEFSHFHSPSEQTCCKWLSCLPWSEGKIEMCHFRDLCSRQKQPENIAGLELTTPLRFCRHRWCCQTVLWLFWWSLVKTPCRWQCSFVSHTVKKIKSHFHDATFSQLGSEVVLQDSALTFGSRGLVENLSLLSPCSSYSSTTRSTVHTANLELFRAQAIHVTLAAPSFIGQDTKGQGSEWQTHAGVMSGHKSQGNTKYRLK